MSITKYNTALDLSQLTDNQIRIISNLTKLEIIRKTDYLMLSNSIGYIIGKPVSFHWTVVDFCTFIKIHFEASYPREQEEFPQVSFHYPLFEHMSIEHGLTLTESELDEIAKIVLEMYNPVPYEQLVEALHENKDTFERYGMIGIVNKIEKLLERIKE